MTYIIRDFKQGDEYTISDIHHKFREYFEEDYISPEFILNCQSRPDFDFIVCENEGKIVGFSGMIFFETVGRAEVGPIVVVKNHQNKKVGKKLLHNAISELDEKGIRRITAIVKKDNSSATSFFLKNGFQIEAELKNYTRKNEDAHQLVFFL